MPSRRWVLRYTTWSLPASFAVNHARIGGTVLKGSEITGIATIKWLGCLRRCWAMLLPTLMDVFVERKLLRCKTSVWIAAICPRRWSSRRLLMSFVIRTTDIAYCKANSEEEHYDHDYYKYHNSPHFDYFWHEGMKYYYRIMEREMKSSPRNDYFWTLKPNPTLRRHCSWSNGGRGKITGCSELKGEESPYIVI